MSRKPPAYNDKQRILRLYSVLISKQSMGVDEIENLFFVGRKTVQRDIAAIREFLADLQVEDEVKSEIIFDRKSKKYRLTEREHLFEVFDRINTNGSGMEL
ncbi:kinase [Fructobacillus americanaquae]|uniref:Kinase n=1 Tax=Fructobacillus americanaquae TaxID=2940302 RepID=A0ABY5BYA3_9LACO|nr:kinase [Fructobacillus americanaquae]USS91491.1 kinase [Fructobacillus americanaquae]